MEVDESEAVQETPSKMKEHQELDEEEEGEEAIQVSPFSLSGLSVSASKTWEQLL